MRYTFQMFEEEKKLCQILHSHNTPPAKRLASLRFRVDRFWYRTQYIYPHVCSIFSIPIFYPWIMINDISEKTQCSTNERDRVYRTHNHWHNHVAESWSKCIKLRAMFSYFQNNLWYLLLDHLELRIACNAKSFNNDESELNGNAQLKNADETNYRAELVVGLGNCYGFHNNFYWLV